MNHGKISSYLYIRRLNIIIIIFQTSIPEANEDVLKTSPGLRAVHGKKLTIYYVGNKSKRNSLIPIFRSRSQDQDALFATENFNCHCTAGPGYRRQLGDNQANQYNRAELHHHQHH